MLIKKFCAIAICFTLAGSAFAQQTPVEDVAAEAAVTADEATTEATEEVVTPKAMLNEEGELVGKAVLEDSEDAPVADAKVSLTVDGKVVAETETAEDGTFAFASVAPGHYQVLGSADGGLIGSQSYDVVGYSDGAIASPCSLGMCGASSEVVYDEYASAPVSSLNTCGACNSCNTCGGGVGAGGGGRLGGGLLSGRRVGLIGLAGLAGLAGLDDNDDASPDF